MIRYNRHLKPLNAKIKYLKTVHADATDKVQMIKNKLSKNR